MKLSATRNCVTVYPSNKITIGGIGSSMKSIKTEGICEGDLMVDGHIINHTFHIVHDRDLSLSADGIIGADLLQKYGAVLNFQTNTLTMKCPSHTMRESIIQHTYQHSTTQPPSPIATDDSPTTHTSLSTSQETITPKVKKPKVTFTNGLDNPDNNMCYANALYQAILRYIFTSNSENDIANSTKCTCINSIIMHLSLKPNKYRILFHNTIRNIMSLTNNQEHQDTMELYHKLIRHFNSQNPCCRFAQMGRQFATECLGSFDIQLKCFSCYHTSKNIEEFNHINIPLSTSIQDSIKTFFNSEQLNDYKCGKCTSTNTTFKTVHVNSLPKYLCFQITRVGKNNMKLDGKIKVPYMLSLSKYITSNTPVQYKLKSAINHIGDSTRAGHFTTYTATSKHRGLLYDDQNITKIMNKNLNTRGIYMIFYERMTDRSTDINTLTTQDRIEEIIQDITVEELDPDTLTHLKTLITNYNDIFHLENDYLTSCKILKHHISLYTDTPPINVRQYRRSQWEIEEIDKHVKKLLRDGIIQPSNSPFNSPALVVPKKGLDKDGNKKTRFVVDYRKLNEATISDNYPLPLIQQILDSLGSACFYTTLDLSSSYHQIELDQASQDKTAFSTSSNHYSYTRMAMGLKGSSHSFARLMGIAMGDYVGKILFLYLDDVVVFSSTITEHLERLQLVFQRLRDVNLKISPEKCHFIKRKIEYLGHIISKDGVLPDSSKIEAITKFPQPSTPKAIKSFLGMVGFYRRFIPNFAGQAAPLTNLLKKDVKFHWSPECQIAFQFFRDSLTKHPILQFPKMDQIFFITCDASSVAISAILSQGEIGSDLPIAFASRTLNDAEKRYVVSETEILSVLFGIQQFRCYIHNRHFKVFSDNKALQWLFQVKKPTSRLMRWKLQLAEYDFEIIHIRGKSNLVADCLSRYTPTQETIHVVTRNQHKMQMEQQDTHYIGTHNVHHENKANKTTPTTTPFILETDDIALTTDYTIHVLLTSIRTMQTILATSQNITIGKIYQNDDDSNILYIAIKIDTDDNVDPNIWDECITNLKIHLLQYNTFKILIKEKDIICFTNEYNTLKTKISEHFTNTDYNFCILKNTIQLLTNITDIQNVLQDFHTNPLSGHQGVNRMTSRIGNQYKWIGMSRDIKDFVRKCPVCQVTKHSIKTKMPMQITTTSTRPFQRLALDIVGPMPESTGGYRYILTFQDDLTKYFGGFPLKTDDSESIAQGMVNNIVLQYGLPESILTDRAQNFLSDLMTKVFKLLGINRLSTSPYHPESNGSLERQHKVLKAMLRAYSDKDNTNWPDFIPFAVFVINTTVNRASGFTPFSLLYGYKMTVPTNLKRKPDPVYTYEDYYTNLRYKLQLSHELAREHLIESKYDNKENYDQHSKPHSYNVGDKILLINNNPKTKMHNLYLGPFEILEIVSDTNVKIKRGNINSIVHHNIIKPYYE